MTVQSEITMARTSRLELAVFLDSSRSMKFIRCEPVNGAGKLCFLFSGLQQDMERLQLEFDAGAEAPVAATIDSWRRLRRVMRSTQNTTHNTQESTRDEE